MKNRLPALLLTLSIIPMAVQADVVTDLLSQYQASGAKDFSAERGARLWRQDVIDKKSGKSRNCSTCHTTDLRQPGKHVRTGKAIKPMAPSTNPKRLTDAKKIRKWLRRNCKWTWGRECTPQEKGDLLSFLKQQ